MNFVVSLLFGKHAKVFWISLSIGIAVLVVYLYWDGRNETISDLTKKNNELQSELIIRKQEYETNLATMQQSIDDQNATIATLHDQMIKAEQNASHQISIVNVENQALADKLKTQLELINSIETPKTCQQAIELLVDVAVQHPWPTERK